MRRIQTAESARKRLLLRALRGLLCLSLLVAPGCVISPVHLAKVPDRSFEVRGFVTTPGTMVMIDAYFDNRGFVPIDYVTSARTPFEYLGLRMSPTLYEFRKVVTPREPFWTNNSTRVRARLSPGAVVGGRTLFMFDRAGLSCVFQRTLDAASGSGNLDTAATGIECSRDANGANRFEAVVSYVRQ